MWTEEPIKEHEIDDQLWALNKRHPESRGLMGHMMLSIGQLFMALYRSDRGTIRGLGIGVAVCAMRIACEGDDEFTQHNILWQGPPK